MQQIKDFLNFLDIIVGTFWSLTLMDILPIVISGQIGTQLLTSVSGIVNLFLSIAGLAYLVVRIVHFIRMSKLHIQMKKEEIIEKQNSNFYKKFIKEFKIEKEE